MTENQHDGLKAAEEDGDYAPSPANAFITQTKLAAQLPGGQAPAEWPIGVTEKLRDGLKAAEDDTDYAPSATNSFVTQSKMMSELPPGVTENSTTASGCRSDSDRHAPQPANTFITQTKLAAQLPSGQAPVDWPSASPSRSTTASRRPKTRATTHRAPPTPSSRRPSWRPNCPTDRLRPTGLSA